MSDDALPKLIRRLIAGAGPIPLSTFMGLALGHPEHGYYQRREPFGGAGDFVTAPEVSQMFGELIGAWCIEVWRRLGAPAPVALCELGPGRGTLMADLLRAARLDPGFLDARDLLLIETSQRLRAQQAERLAAWRPRWIEGPEALPACPALVLANEVFDALPIRQFVKSPEGWRERLVDLGPDAAGFRFVLGPASAAAAALVPDAAKDLPEGAVVEVSPEAEHGLDLVARHLARHGGAALILDYGAELAPGTPSLQAIAGGARADPLAAPGSADLTAHVDFARLAAVARAAGLAVHGPKPQGAFLEALGLGQRTAALARGQPPEVARRLEGERRRLSHPEEMGRLFKALALAPPALGAPPGFEL